MQICTVSPVILHRVVSPEGILHGVISPNEEEDEAARVEAVRRWRAAQVPSVQRSAFKTRF